MRISDWSSDVCSSDLTATESTSPASRTSPTTAPGWRNAPPWRRCWPRNSRHSGRTLSRAQGGVLWGFLGVRRGSVKHRATLFAECCTARRRGARRDSHHEAHEGPRRRRTAFAPKAPSWRFVSFAVPCGWGSMVFSGGAVKRCGTFFANRYTADRKRVVSAKSEPVRVSLGVCRINKQKKIKTY